nr:hypothetical protein [uncultured archaeon]
MIDALKKNIEREIEMLREISSYTNRLDYATDYERKLLTGARDALIRSMKLINDSIPEILRDISLSKKLPSITAEKKTKIERKGLEEVSYRSAKTDVVVVLKEGDKEKFFKELSINESLVSRLRKKNKAGEEEKPGEFKGARGYLKISNKFFLNSSIKAIHKGYFKGLSSEIRKANLDILFETYIAMLFFSTVLAFVFGIIVYVVFIFVDFGFAWPFFSAYDGSYLIRMGKIAWILLAVPLATYLLLYIYPSTEKKSIGKSIDQELPFAVIHMSAISGSGIVPAEIFKIIGTSREYPYLRREVRKILNQINLYGYDLVTALINSAKAAPSERLAELFSGLATTITSGASLMEFFEKRAETLLMNYRLEREKYTKIAETFMDIYISVVIAAPMVLLLLLIMLSITGADIIFSPGQLSFLVVLVIGLLNVFFLWFLQLKQPRY